MGEDEPMPGRDGRNMKETADGMGIIFEWLDIRLAQSRCGHT
jgi:hypothetical protein